MEENDLSEQGWKRAVVGGVMWLGARRVGMQIVITLTNVVLARTLTPEDFGAFAIISFWILTGGLAVNFGLGPALLQTKGKLTKEQLRSIFTVLVVGAGMLVGVAWWGSNLAKDVLGMSHVLRWLPVFSLFVFFDHMTAISTFLLQRDLEYKKLSIGQVLITLVTQTAVVILALKNYGVGSFVYGNLIGGVIGVAVFYGLKPWPVGLNFDWKNLRGLWNFGLNYQANNLVSALNSAVVPVYVGSIVGERAVGLINWAGGVRQAGLAPAEMMEKIIFPAAARAQNNQKLLKALVEKMLRISCLLSFPLLVMIGVLAGPLTYLVYSAQWLAGLGSLYLCLVQGGLMLVDVLLIDVLLGLGKVKLIRNLAVGRMVVQWGLTIPLVRWWGFNGVVVAGIVVGMSFLIPLAWVRREMVMEFWPNVLPYLGYSGLTGAVTWLIARQFEIVSIWQLMGIGLVGGMVYLVLLWLFKWREVMSDIMAVGRGLGSKMADK